MAIDFKKTKIAGAANNMANAAITAANSINRFVDNGAKTVGNIIDNAGYGQKYAEKYGNTLVGKYLTDKYTGNQAGTGYDPSGDDPYKSGAGDNPPSTPLPQTPMDVTPTQQQQTAQQAADNVTNAGKVYGDMISGDAFNAHRISQQEALARNEANQRGLVAQQIHQAGFSGQPVGSMYANAAEAQLAQNRFKAMTDLEVARQEGRMAGADRAVQHEQGVLTNDQLRRQVAGNNLNTAFDTNPQWMDTIASGKIDTLINDPSFRAAMGDYYNRMTGKDIPNPGDANWNEFVKFAKNSADFYRTNSTPWLRNVEAARGYLPQNATEEQINTVAGLLTSLELKATGADVNFDFEVDKNGNVTVKVKDIKQTAETDEKETMKYNTGDDYKLGTDAGNKYVSDILTDVNKKGTEEYNAIVEDLQTYTATDAGRRLIANMDETARNKLLDEWKENGHAITESVKYVRNPEGLSSASGYPVMDKVAGTGKVIFIQGHPAVVVYVDEKGKKIMGGDGDYRHTYGVMYLDDPDPKQRMDKFDGDHSTGHVATYR